MLRLGPARSLFIYYTGTMPFVLGLLYFWADMSQNAFSEAYCAVAALGLAIGFVWMKCWQTVFTIHVRSQISGIPERSWSAGRVIHMGVTQTVIHSSGLFLMPVALVLGFPFAWCYAFYQNVSAQDDGEIRDTKEMCRMAWEQAKCQPLQNHMMLLIFALLSIYVFLNLGIALLLLPTLLKKFFGIETLFTMSGHSVLNTTFLSVTCGMSYLCMDPLVKTVYTLRCFYGSSLGSGDDLKAELKSGEGRGDIRIGIHSGRVVGVKKYIWSFQHNVCPVCSSAFRRSRTA